MASSAGHGFFGSWVRSPPSTIINFSDFPMSNLKITLPGIPRKWNGLGKWQVRPCIRPTCYPAVKGGKSVVRLSLGKLLVNLVQVVESATTEYTWWTDGVLIPRFFTRDIWRAVGINFGRSVDPCPTIMTRTAALTVGSGHGAGCTKTEVLPGGKPSSSPQAVADIDAEGIEGRRLEAVQREAEQEWQELEAGGQEESIPAASVPALLQMAANQVQQDMSLTEVCPRTFRLVHIWDFHEKKNKKITISASAISPRLGLVETCRKCNETEMFGTRAAWWCRTDARSCWTVGFVRHARSVMVPALMYGLAERLVDQRQQTALVRHGTCYGGMIEEHQPLFFSLQDC